jgi:hypothetical protein
MVEPWIDPVGYVTNEVEHLRHIARDPVGHAVQHVEASARAFRDGRPLDALHALYVNDMYEVPSSRRYG